MKSFGYKSLDKPFTILVSRCPPVGNEFENLRLGLAAHGLVCPYSTNNRNVFTVLYELSCGEVSFTASIDRRTLMKFLENFFRQLQALFEIICCSFTVPTECLFAVISD
ncbi:hypothetical protein BJAS_P3876 [Bathymodiolus japonicus methanotrophic gill symbiont]|nr:hypothetical protein BJAS_P3876 [Bathymodiolus japonicus methanotrophic gill symbiont]